MTFLHNPEVYSKIVENFLKNAQGATPVPPTEVIKQIVNRLDSQINTISSDNPNGADLRFSDLTAPKLLKFLADNGIQVDNKKIVYSASDFLSKVPDPKEQIKFNQIGDDYFVNVDGLKKYIDNLQNKMHSKNNALVKAKFAVLIDQINNLIGTKFSRETGVQNVGTVGENEIVDSLSKVFDEISGAVIGEIKLTAKDLKSRADLNGWLRENPEATVIFHDKNGKEEKHSYTDPHGDVQRAWNIIVNGLKKRADYLVSIEKIGQEKIYEFYKNAVEALNSGSSIPSDTGISGSSNFSGSMDNYIDNIVASVPFNTRSIDLNKIEAFFDYLQKFVSFVKSSSKSDPLTMKAKTRANNLNQYVNIVQQYVSQLNSFLRSPPATVFPMTDHPREFVDKLVNPTAYLSSIALLEKIVNETAQALQEFSSIYEDYGSEAQQEKLHMQVGTIANANSILTYSHRFLNGLRENVAQVMPGKQ